MNKIYLFSKDSCGPCRLVEKYLQALSDDRSKLIKKVDLEDVSDFPIPQENLDLAKQYGVTATPVLVVTSQEGTLLESYTGGVDITKNILKVFEKHTV